MGIQPARLASTQLMPCLGRAAALMTLSLLACGSQLAIAQDGLFSEQGLNDDPLRHCKVAIIREISVPAEEAGVLEELNVEEGDHVEQGQLLGSVDHTDAELAVAIATHEFAAAKKTAENTISIEAAAKAYEVALAELEGSNEANRKSPGTVTLTEVRRQKLQADRAKLQAELASHELLVARFDAQAKYKSLQRAQRALERRQITARINGVIVERNKHAGDWVQPGETVVRIVQMDRLRIEGNVDGRSHARSDVLGRTVRITVHLTGGQQEQLMGRIVYASPIIKSGEYTVRAEIDNRKVNGAWVITPGLDAEMELVDAARNAAANGLNFE